MKIRCVLPAAAIALAISGRADAATLAMDYTITPQAGGVYLYDFSLKLTDDDGTWVPGQQWDWIVFGDRSASGQPSGFCPVDCSADGIGGLDPGFQASASFGGSQGPMIFFGDLATPPGWQPSAIGDSTTWTYLSSIYLPQGQLYWTPVVTIGTPPIQFELATQLGAAAVPEPSTWAMLIAGFGAIGFATRRRRRQVRVAYSA